MQRELSLQEFRDGGYLQEVNRRVLHPLGLALSVETDDAGRVIGFGPIWDERDDPEGIVFAEMNPDHALKVETEWQLRRPARMASIGHMIQPALYREPVAS